MESKKSRIAEVAPFLTFAVLLLAGMTYVVYRALASAFFVTSHVELAWIGWSLAALSLGFLAATIVGMRFYNIFTRAFYVATAVWIGTFVYLFLFSLLYGLVVAFTGEQGLLSILFIAAVVMTSSYGVAHAAEIRIRHVEVELPGLPMSWRGRKAVWVSDLHLGQLHGPRFTQKVVDLINSVPHDLVLIGGDLYDGTTAPDAAMLIAPLHGLKRADGSHFGTYYVTGNHEEFGSSGKFIDAVKATGIKVLMDESVVIDGLQLVGVDYSNASKTERFQQILSGLSINPPRPTILIKHEPSDLAVAEAAGVSLQISGHTHKAQMWPFEYIAQRTYKGFAYGLKRFGAMQVYVSSGTGTWGPPLRVGTNSEIVVFTFK